MMSIAVFILFFILSFLLGSWTDTVMAKLRRESTLPLRIASGGCILIMTAMAACLIGGAAHLPANVTAIVALCALIVIAVSGIVMKKRTGSGLKVLWPHFDQKSAAMTAVCALITALQVYGAVSYAFENAHVLEGVRVAAKVFDSGRMFTADPMMLIVGLLSRITGVHPLNLIFGVLPATLITFYYVCYAAVIFEVTDGYKRFVSFVAVSLLNLFGYQSQVLIPATLLLSWSGTWVFIIHGLLGTASVILNACMKALPDKVRADENEINDELLEEWDMKNHRIINARNLAIALGVLAAALIGTIVVLNGKINSLYAATLNLQEDMNSRCAMYEFVGADGKVEGYLLRGSDGTLSFIGGGSSANADDLADFIGKYGTSVTKWYVYGEDEESAGAMRTLTSNGTVDAEKVFVISADELTE